MKSTEESNTSNHSMDGSYNVIRIPIEQHFAGDYRIEYDSKYISLYGKDKNYKCMFGDSYEEMVLIPVVIEIRKAAPKIIETTDTEIVVSLGCR
jgi:hypothetical protein